MRERLPRQREARGIGQCARVGAQLGKQRRVVGRIDDDSDMAMILRRGAHHRRAADVDVLDRLIERAVGARHRRAKRVQVDDDQLDPGNIVPLQRVHVLGQIASCEDAAMHTRMQRLHAAVEHFRKACVVADLGHRQAGPGERLRGAAGGQ